MEKKYIRRVLDQCTKAELIYWWTMRILMVGGMIFTVVANYNTPNVPVYKNAGLQGDGILETRAMSFGATVSEIGKTLSELESMAE